jgi:hypothetical protein
MRSIETTVDVRPGMVILTGTAYYYVTDVFPRKIRGHVWALPNDSKWGPIRDVPLPSPTCSAYVVENAGELFPYLPVSLVKSLSQWKYFRNDGEPPTEYELAWRRYQNGARVSAEWGYYLRNNDLNELAEYYRHGKG